MAAAHDPSSKMPAAQRKKLSAATDYVTAAEKVVRVATDARSARPPNRTCYPLTARDPRRVAELAGGEYGVTSSVGRLQKALDGLPSD